MAANTVSGLREVFATVRRTKAAHVSALDALERAFSAETEPPETSLESKFPNPQPQPVTLAWL